MIPENVTEIKDQFLWTKENKTITFDHHHVNGLANFTHWNYKSATASSIMHYHENIYEIHCMVRGKRRFEVFKNGELSTSTITGNQLSITFPGQIHGYKDNFIDPYEFYAVQIDISNNENLLGLDPLFSKQLVDELKALELKMKNLENQQLLLGRTHINLIQRAFTFFSFLDEKSIRTGTMFLNCFLFSLKYLSISPNAFEIDTNITKAVDYIQNNPTEDLSIPSLAHLSGYSCSYFKSKFKNETGMTPTDFIRNTRLEAAKNMLIKSNIKISMLSDELGYSSTSYFCFVFKKYTSYSPSEYRELYRQQFT